MTSLLIFIAISVFFFVSLTLWNQRQRKKDRGGESKQPASPVVEGGCCGKHAACAKNVAQTSPCDEELDYFDDEDLDRFKGKFPSDYSEEETKEFRDIFHSLLDKDRSDWLQSLEKREVAIPAALADEISGVIVGGAQGK